MRKTLIAAVLGIAATGAFAQQAGADYDNWNPGAGSPVVSRGQVKAAVGRDALVNPTYSESALWTAQAGSSVSPVSRAAVREEVRQALARGEVLPVEQNEATQFAHAQRGVSTSRFAGR